MSATQPVTGVAQPEPVTSVVDAEPVRSVLVAAWTVVLALSLLPVVLAQEVAGRTVSDDARLVVGVVVVAGGLLATVAWARGRVLRPLLWLFLVLAVAQWVVFTQLDRVPVIRDLLHGASFGSSLLTELGLKLLVTLAMIATLLVLHRDRRAFYLAKGDLDAPAAPIRWLGVSAGTRWSTLGPILSVCITLGTLTFLLVSGVPSADRLARALPVLLVVLVAAALNAFNEEMTYKASFLSVLVVPVGPRHALRMVAAWFGLAHFYGVPYGVVGVVLAWFLGWILARSMLETRGLAWAWFIHFLQDVVIFGFLAVGAITPGGR